MDSQAKLLVVGYGNTLRRDDGAGVKVAELLEEMQLPGVEVLILQQLVPELAEPVAKAQGVVFVDAADTKSEEPVLAEVKPSMASRIFAHASDPGSILALAGLLYGASPKAWSLAVPAHDFGYGDGISARTMRGVPPATRLLRKLAAEFIQQRDNCGAGLCNQGQANGTGAC